MSYEVWGGKDAYKSFHDTLIDAVDTTPLWLKNIGKNIKEYNEKLYIMPELIPGYNTEQKVVTVANSDAAINAEITTQAVDSWTVSLLTISGGNVILLFTRTIPLP